MSAQRQSYVLAAALLLASARGVAAQQPEVAGGWPAPAIETAEAAPELVRVEALAGAGLGTRAFRRPTPDGEQRLGTSAFPAVDVGMRVRVWPEARLSLDALLRYQNSLGFSVDEEPLFALTEEVDVRASRVELSAAPRLQLGTSDTFALAVPVGFTMRSFVADYHDLGPPTYALAGPLLRAELIATITPLLQLRAGPEAQFVFVIGDDVRADGVGASGFAVGFEATLAVPFAPDFAFELSVRESHAFAAGRGDRRDLNDVERFVIGRLTGAL